MVIKYKIGIDLIMTEEYDIIIIGAGPGGSSAGSKSATLGFKTLILEKEEIGEQGRYKACGGAMDQKLVDKIHFPENLIDWSVHYLVLHYIGDDTFDKHGIGDVVWRSKFDKYLTDLAIDAGAELHDGEPLISIEKEKTYKSFILKSLRKEV